VEEIRPGLWTWTAPHPESDEQPAVRSYAVERDGVLVLIDPMSPPTELVEGRELQVALTCPWHSRSALELQASEADVEGRPGFYPDERVLWLPAQRALVFGDSFPGGPIPDNWLPEGQRVPTTRPGWPRSSSYRSSSYSRRTANRVGVTCWHTS
jgi:hypothetical protein